MYCQSQNMPPEYMDAVIEHSFDGIFITDGQANVIKANQSYAHISGLKIQDLLGHNMMDLVNGKIISESGTLLALQRKKPVTLHQQFKTGKEALITSTPIFNSNGDIVLVITNVRDITELLRFQEAIHNQKKAEERLRLQLDYLRSELASAEGITLVDEASLNVFHLLKRAAPLDTTIMLMGESGVGKEVFAKLIHNNSPRQNKPFIKINCGAIADTLVESELFGYEKGAFTGADKNGKPGLLELADQGTLFLDEVGELPLHIQVKLLHVLQDRQFERVGGRKSIKLNTRIVAATNRNMEEMVAEKKFREDLYYRLMVFPVHIPPLRQRPRDIIPIATTFLNELNRKYGAEKEFTPSAIKVMTQYSWPGNIRELRNVIERAFIISPNTIIDSRALHLDANKSEPCRSIMETSNSKDDFKTALCNLESHYLEQAYAAYGNVRDAAESLGMSPATFVRKRQKLNKKT